MAVTVCPFNEDLIDLVQNNPALYNCNLPGYKSDEYKLNTWQEISERLGEKGKFFGVKIKFRLHNKRGFASVLSSVFCAGFFSPANRNTALV